MLVLTSPDYGLAYCFLAPVFLFLLILAYPHVDRFALRVTAFNGLLYGLFNLSHWGGPGADVVGGDASAAVGDAVGGAALASLDCWQKRKRKR